MFLLACSSFSVIRLKVDSIDLTALYMYWSQCLNISCLSSFSSVFKMHDKTDWSQWLHRDLFDFPRFLNKGGSNQYSCFRYVSHAYSEYYTGFIPSVATWQFSLDTLLGELWIFMWLVLDLILSTLWYLYRFRYMLGLFQAPHIVSSINMDILYWAHSLQFLVFLNTFLVCCLSSLSSPLFEINEF